MDFGVTWIDLMSGNRGWYRLLCSGNGQQLIAMGNVDFVYVSNDYGVTLTPVDSQRQWSGVASSSDFTKMIASVYGDHLYTSIDGGMSWTPQLGSPVLNWTGVASTTNGTFLVACASDDQNLDLQ